MVKWLCFLMSPLMASATLRIEPIVPPVLRQQLQQDLIFLQSLRVNQQLPLHQEIFGNAVAAEYVFFVSRIHSISISQFDCGERSVACADGYGAYASLWLTARYQNSQMPQIARLSVLIHEARHTERRGWPHVHCPRPFLDESGNSRVSRMSGVELAGTRSCDATEYGAYGTQAIFLKNTSLFCDETVCNEKLRVDAQIYGDDAAHRILNQ